MENQSSAVQTISINQIKLKPEYQSREIIGRNVDNFKTAYINEQPIDPLTVMRINGELCLIKGWHRMEALTQLGRQTAEVIIIEGRLGITAAEVRVIGALDNTKNGEALNTRQRQQIFHDYMEAGMNRRGAVGLKSYREIVKELPCFKLGTVHGWMKKYHPDVARKMAKKHPEDEPEGWDGMRDMSKHAPQTVAIRQIKETLSTLHALVQQISSHYVRGDALKIIEEKITKLEKLKHKHRENGVLADTGWEEGIDRAWQDSFERK
jgi:hypothetical protein